MSHATQQPEVQAGAMKMKRTTYALLVGLALLPGLTLVEALVVGGIVIIMSLPIVEIAGSVSEQEGTTSWQAL